MQRGVITGLPFDPVPFPEELLPGVQPAGEKLLLVREGEVEIGRVVPRGIHEDRPRCYRWLVDVYLITGFLHGGQQRLGEVDRVRVTGTRTLTRSTSPSRC